MLKQGIKNYFVSLKHFFTPLGTMFLGIMIGLSVLFNGVVASASALIEGIKVLSQNVNLDFNVLFDKVWNEVISLNWNEPVEAVKTVVSAEWVNNTLSQVLSALLGTDFETFALQLVELIAVFCQSVTVYIVLFFLCWILGFIAGFALIRFFIRRDIAKRSLWKFILAYMLNSIVSTAFVVGTLIVYSIWSYSIIIAVVLALLLSGIIALVQAYVLYGYKKIPFRNIVNFKNACSHTLANLIIFAISIVFTLIAVGINKLMGVFVGLSIVTIAIIVINLNAESFVIEEVLGVSVSPRELNVEADNSALVLDEIK